RREITLPDHDLNISPLELLPGFTLNGKVTIEGDGSKGAVIPPSLRVMIEPADGMLNYGIRFASVDPSGNFILPGIFVDRYRVRIRELPQAFYVKAVIWDGREVTDSPFQVAVAGPIYVVLGSDPGTVSGNVVNDNSEPVGGAVIVLRPASASTRNVQTYGAISTSDGRFNIGGIVPGDYQVAAFVNVPYNLALDPDFTPSHSTASTEVTIQGRETKIITVKSTF